MSTNRGLVNSNTSANIRNPLWLAAAALVLVLAGCSDTTSTGTASSETASAPTAEPTPAVPTVDPTTVEAPVPAEETAPDEAAEQVPEETAPDEAAEQVPEDDTTPQDASEGNEIEPLAGVITDIVADAQGGRAFFDGTVNEEADLEDLVADAWGDGDLGLHRGHAQVENLLEAFLGIDHAGMHEYMDQGLNLAATAERVGQNPDALVESLTASYAPFVAEGVEGGVISADQAQEWVELIRTEFRDRVYWDGLTDS